MIKTCKGQYIQLGEMEKSVAIDRFVAVLDLNWDYIFTLPKLCVNKEQIHLENQRPCQLSKIF